MELAFRIWRFIALLSLGVIFFIEMTCMVFRSLFDSWVSFFVAMASHVGGDPGKVASLITAVLLLSGVTGIVGLIGLDLIRSGVASTVSLVGSIFTWRTPNSWLGDLTQPYPKLAVRYLKKHDTSLLEYLTLLNLGLQKLKQKNAVVDYGRNVKNHLLKVDIADIIAPVSFHYVVTQDQFRADRLRDEISTIESLWVVLPLFVIDVWLCKSAENAVLVSALICGLLMAFSLPALAERRRDYAAILMVGYIANFALSEASVEDRAM